MATICGIFETVTKNFINYHIVYTMQRYAEFQDLKQIFQDLLNEFHKKKTKLLSHKKYL